MSLRIDSGCVSCFFNNQLNLARTLGTEEQAVTFLRRLMALYLEMSPDMPMPCLGPQEARLLYEMYGLPIDRYHQEKIDSNRFVLDRLSQIRERLSAAPDPLLAGLQLAILGNYIDFVALRGKVDFAHLDEQLCKALEMELDEAVFQELRADLAGAKTLLYVTDNAGEIGFDRIFAEEIARQYPDLQITFCVRGGIAANDATREDAAAVGIPFPVIDSGSSIAGTYLPLCGEDCRRAFREADVIISKGMANVETLWGCGHNVYYALLVKCQRFQKHFDRPLFSPVLAREPK